MSEDVYGKGSRNTLSWWTPCRRLTVGSVVSVYEDSYEVRVHDARPVALPTATNRAEIATEPCHTSGAILGHPVPDLS